MLLNMLYKKKERKRIKSSVYVRESQYKVNP